MLRAGRIAPRAFFCSQFNPRIKATPVVRWEPRACGSPRCRKRSAANPRPRGFRRRRNGKYFPSPLQQDDPPSSPDYGRLWPRRHARGGRGVPPVLAGRLGKPLALKEPGAPYGVGGYAAVWRAPSPTIPGSFAAGPGRAQSKAVPPLALRHYLCQCAVATGLESALTGLPLRPRPGGKRSAA